MSNTLPLWLTLVLAKLAGVVTTTPIETICAWLENWLRGQGYSPLEVYCGLQAAVAERIRELQAGDPRHNINPNTGEALPALVIIDHPTEDN